MNDIIDAREREAQSVALVEHYSEAGGVPQTEAEEMLIDEDVFKADFLAPFLPVGAPRSLTARQAKEVREACLKVGSYSCTASSNLCPVRRWLLVKYISWTHACKIDYLIMHYPYGKGSAL